MTRAEHVAWAKKRALEYADKGDIAGAIGSMQSDLTKWEGGDLYAPELLRTVMADGMLFRKTAADVRNWVEGFN